MSLLIKENLISLLSACVFFLTQYLPLVLATNNRIANNVISCNVDA